MKINSLRKRGLLYIIFPFYSCYISYDSWLNPPQTTEHIRGLAQMVYDQSLRTSGRGSVLSLEAAHRVGACVNGCSKWTDGIHMDSPMDNPKTPLMASIQSFHLLQFYMSCSNQWVSILIKGCWNFTKKVGCVCPTEVQGIQKRKSSCWHWREFLSCRRRKTSSFEESGRFLKLKKYHQIVPFGERERERERESFIRLCLSQIGPLTHCEMIDLAVSSWWRSGWKSGPDSKLGISWDGNLSLRGRFGMLATSPLDVWELSAFWGWFSLFFVISPTEIWNRWNRWNRWPKHLASWLMILGGHQLPSYILRILTGNPVLET